MAASLLAACSGGSTAPAASTAAPRVASTSSAAKTAGSGAAAPNPLIKPTATGADLTAVQASSEVALGRNRFAVGLIDAHNQPISSGTVDVQFFKLTSNRTAEKRFDAPAVFRSVGGPTKGIWVAPASFTETGAWGAQVTLTGADGQSRATRMSFEVAEHFSAPGYDQAAVRSASLTERAAGGDPSRICSNTPPCAFHTTSIADALAPGQKPLVVLFATPALCTSAICAPELQAVTDLHARYPDAATFVHVELYQYPFDAMKLVPAVDEWHLPSDPWTFVVDRGGIVRDRFEGAAPVEELEPALRAVLS